MHSDPWSSVRSTLPAAWAALTLLQSCSRLVTEPLDLRPQIDVSSVAPAPGPVDPNATFRVDFSAPVDLSVLLVDPDTSDAVVLVPAQHADLVAAAMAHGRLNATMRKLVVDALAEAADDASAIDIWPRAALPSGNLVLLVSPRLRDPQGRATEAPALRFAYSVGPAAPALSAALESPEPGSRVPSNLRRVRAFVPPGAAVAVTGIDGAIVGGPVTADGGSIAIALQTPPSGACNPLCPGATYALAVEGRAVPSASFEAASCARVAPPDFERLQTIPGDTWVEVMVRTDWPAALRVEARAACGSDGGACGGPVAQREIFIRCATEACDLADGAACEAVARLTGLAPASRYVVSASASDDQDNRASREVLVETRGDLPKAIISEVMASPPLPTPRSNGEYIEVLNAGTTALDLSELAIAAPDEPPRRVVGGVQGGPRHLAPGERALAVGADFDPTRYALEPDLPVARADSRRLLGRGLADQPPPIKLMWVPPRAADAGTALELDRYPGNGPRCREGESLERAGMPGGGEVVFRCGADGGSPGR